jgi:NTP pyrophosphatase (non-canonical NTP hydrolase)
MISGVGILREWKKIKQRKMKNFDTLVAEVVIWAGDRGIFDAADPLAQLDKTQEELDETIDAVRQSAFNNPEVVDGIGDMLVTIIIAAKMLGLDPTYCLSEAYEEIKNRTGKMVDGKFVKDQ